MRALVLLIFLMLVTAGGLLLLAPEERAAAPAAMAPPVAAPDETEPATPPTPATAPRGEQQDESPPAPQEPGCIPLTPFEERALAAEMRAWSGELGRAENRTNWPYEFYEDEILERLAREGDAEAAYQLAMNYRWRFLYPGAGSSWNNREVPESFTRTLRLDQSDDAQGMDLASEAASFYMLAATGGHVFAIEEMGRFVDELSELLTAASANLPDTADSDQAFRLKALESSLEDLRKASAALSEVPYMIMPALAQDNGLPLATAAEPSLEVVQMQNMLITGFHEMRAERGLPPFDESIPPGVSRYLARCK